MNQKIQTILNDLYLLDPDFRQHQAELIKIIEKIIISRPDTKFDQQFASELKAKLLSQEVSPAKKFIFNFNFMSKLSYAGLGAAAILIILVPIFYFSSQFKPNLNLKTSFTAVSNQAFGKLSVATTADNAPQEQKVLGLGGGGSLGSAVDMRIMPPWFEKKINYNFNYTGELELPETVPVLRRQKNTDSLSISIAKNITRLNLDILNLSRLQNVKVENVTILEDKEKGYTLYLNLNEGMFSIGQNWNRWQVGECGDKPCGLEPLKMESMLADEEIIRIAEDFIKRFDIDLSSYGKPEVNKDWQIYYIQAESRGEPAYLPDQVQVVYPLVINGKQVYEQSGQKVGMNVTVDIRLKTATNMYGLGTQNYEVSNYSGLTDTEQAQAWIKKGGLLQKYVYDDPEETINVELGNYELAYVQIWKYSNFNSEQILVPALIFPITNEVSREQLYQRNIILPLAKEILEENENRDLIPTPLLREPAIDATKDESTSIQVQ